jgi:hypothetical protein
MNKITTTDIQKYKAKYLPNLEVVKRFYESMSLNEAIELGAKAIDPNNKMNPHQRRIGYRMTKIGADELLKYAHEISRSSTFDDVYHYADEVGKSIHGLGPLWSYDTALRIGFQKKCYPKEIYVQCGVKKGLLKCGIAPKERKIELHCLPETLKDLEPYAIENFLCVWASRKWLH